jgi:hypothetical protein
MLVVLGGDYSIFFIVIYNYINSRNAIITMTKVIIRALIDAIGTVAYVVLVASFMFSLQGLSPKEDTIFVIASMLLLFVCSAAITGFLVFGKPIMLYIDGKKKEAVSLLVYTIGILFLITLIIFFLLIASNNLF